MTRFHVATVRDNHGSRLIGYQVISQSKFGGTRYHFSIEAQHPSSLARAKKACERKAVHLQKEADANRARQKMVQ